jgi:hypothetical protein
MMNLLVEAGAKFNTTGKDFERLGIPYSFINQFLTSFTDSSILTQNEGISLSQMLNNLTEPRLIYRASRDGFAVSSFHSKCDNIANTVTIIKTLSNSVFGGFTSAKWTSNGGWTYDSNAFIFSLRRSGNSNKERFNVTYPNYAIYSDSSYGPVFGDGVDIFVKDSSNTNENSYSNIGHSYQLPKNITFESVEAQSYLSGSYRWKTTEIEVYQVTPYSVTFLHNGCLFLFNLKNYLLILISFKVVYNNNTNLVNLLIRTGVNLNIQDKYGLTPLHYGNSLNS